MDFKLGFYEGYIKNLINNINIGLELARISKSETPNFDNGVGIGKYRYIYQQLLESNLENSVTFKSKRHNWPFSQTYCYVNKTLLGVISKKNLETKQKKPPKNMHYTSAESIIYNENFTEKLPVKQRPNQQLNFFEPDREQAEKITAETMGDFEGNVEVYCLLTLDIVNHELIGIEANVTNGNFDILYSENWSKYINLSSFDENDSENQQPESPQHQLKPKLKNHHQKTEGSEQ